MAYEIYPTSLDSPTAEDRVVSQTFSLALGINDDLYIRIAMSKADCSSSSGSAEPTVCLKAGSGNLTEVPADIYDNTLQIPNFFVGNATFDNEGGGVFLLSVSNMARPVSDWEISITNNDHVAHFFTWVVADNNAESMQPWLDISSTTAVSATTSARELNFDDTTGKIILTGQEDTHTLQISNKGTGALRITDPAGTIGGSNFEIISVPGDILPNTCSDMEIRFNAPASPGESIEIYNIASADGLADSDPDKFHNRQVELHATCGKLEIVMVLDASGSMAFTPDGSAPAGVVEDSRWGKMIVAARQILDLLGFFAGNLGKIGIVIFPEITEPPETYLDPTAKIIHPSDLIPSDLTSIKDLLDTDENTPDAGFGWTPIGKGIELAMGGTATEYGLFESSDESINYNIRWLLLMSDGAHNQRPPDPLDFYGTGGSSFKGKKIRIAAAAYGDPGAINFPPDHAQMQDIANESYDTGVYLDAGADDEGEDILKAFRSALTAQLSLDPTTDPGGVLTESVPEIKRHISVLPYDSKVAFVVNWASFDENRVHVQLMTPNCELITPEVARSSPQIQYHSHPRYAIYTFPNDYLRNASDPSKPRYGNWILIISGNGLNDGDSEPYEYEVITQSHLKMRLEFDKPENFAGEAITLSAKITLDGKPIQNATVTLQISAPGQSALNWLAKQQITSEDYDKAAESLKGADVTPLAIKAHAVKQKGLDFKPFIRHATTAMTDPENRGEYSTTYEQTTIPGIYNFHVTAIGQTKDGVVFRREKQLQKYLDVRPVADFTLYHVVYRKLSEKNQPYLQIDIRVWPKDCFDNAVLIEPNYNPIIELTSQSCKPAGTLVGNLDGSYSRTFRSESDAKITFNLKVKGEDVIENQKILSVSHLHYADQVVAFEPGLKDKDQSDQHHNPKDALGDVTIKKEDSFVCLGVSGSIVLGIKDQVIHAGSGEDVVVFVKPDIQLHPYQVEALPVYSKDQWIEIGSSPGVTTAFGLRRAGIKSVKAVRINDRSSPSGTSSGELQSVRLLGVGFESVGPENLDARGWFVQLFAIVKTLIDSLSGKRNI